MKIDRFYLDEQIHEGLYGPIFRGSQLQPCREPAAIQLLQGGGPPPHVQALQAHLQTLNKLALDYVPAPLGCGQLADGRLYLASRWVADYGLRRCPPAEALRWGQGIAACLDAAQQHGLFHLQLRPSQILVQNKGRSRRCCLLGLGLYQLLGPPAKTLPAPVLQFLAPEQPGRSELLANPGAADVYSLAKLLLSMLGLPAGAPLAELARLDRLLGAANRQVLTSLLGSMLAAQPQQRPPMQEVNARLYDLLQRRQTGWRSLLIGGRWDRRQRPPSASPSRPSALQTVTDLRLRSDSSAARRTPTDPLIGQKFGSYRLLLRLGSGAMGAVYEARHELIGHRAAIKVMSPDLVAGSEYARRFLDEARAVNIVAHPGIVSIGEFGERPDGLLYIVMELLSGETLESLLQRSERALPAHEALPLALQLAQALAAAHQCDVVHRDIKPSDIALRLARR